MKREVAIAFKNVTKSYNPNLGLKSILRTYFSLENPTRAIPVLNEVTFNIYKSDFFFILGDNGAGKSTLLKMISGVLKPTSGSIEIKGEVGAIHELTAGFNYELNGYDNLKLLATIKNIQDIELKENLDDIIAFSELSDHDLKKPLKYYSTGMKTRLAYAMNITFVKDILLLDEVLAVGDKKFRNKCIGKLEELKEQGKTIVMVTHETSQIKELLTNGVELFNNKALIHDTYKEYINNNLIASSHLNLFPKVAKGFGFNSITIQEGKNLKTVTNTALLANRNFTIDQSFSKKIKFSLNFDSTEAYKGVTLIVGLENIEQNLQILHSKSKNHNIKKGQNILVAQHILPLITEGNYIFNIFMVYEEKNITTILIGLRILLKSIYRPDVGSHTQSILISEQATT